MHGAGGAKEKHADNTIPFGLLTLSLEHLLDTDRKMEVHSLFMKLRVRNESYCSG
jgi:hypothetical protein